MLLESAIQYQVEECIRFTVLIPPLVMPDGRKLKLVDQTGHIQGSLPPIKFLVPDEEGGYVNAQFWPAEMRWEVIDG